MAFGERGKKDTLLWLAFKEITKTILTSMDNNSNICSPQNHKCPVTDDDSLTDKTSKRHLAFNGFCIFFFPYESSTLCKMYFSHQ